MDLLLCLPAARHFVFECQRRDVFLLNCILHRLIKMYFGLISIRGRMLTGGKKWGREGRMMTVSAARHLLPQHDAVLCYTSFKICVCVYT